MLMIAPTNCQAPLIFDVTKANKDTYSQLMTTLRNTLKDPKGRAYFGVPMLPGSPNPKYLKLVLKSDGQNSITIAIHKRSLYLYAYCDSSNRARFTSDFPKEDNKATLFDNTREIIDLGFSSTYQSIEGVVGKDRRNFQMSLQILKTHINKLCTATSAEIKSKAGRKVEAEFLLLVVQMVSEAVRTKYIEKFIKERFQNPFTPDDKMIDFQKKWDKNSVRIASAKTEKEVQDILGDMGMLKYIAPSKYMERPLMQLATENGTAWA